VPTPFQHLHYAERVLNHPYLPQQLRDLLYEQIGPFLLGTTAADVQTITGQHRVDTHFYTISEGRNGSAAGEMLAQFPALVDPRTLTPARAAFVTGYIVHLAWDELWAWDIFVPYYLEGTHWPDRRSFFIHHNALRVWLDRVAFSHLPDRPELALRLRSTVPSGWLPFAPDAALVEWRDWLAQQLDGSAGVQTAEVFADRMRVTVANLEAIVAEIISGSYRTVPDIDGAVGAYERAALTESIRGASRYWGLDHNLDRVAATEGVVVARG